jgi:uncharacterized protein YjbI with pentapeptide repeats
MKQMTAQEVLQRYRNGERDFRRVNLRGLSFKEENLAGADFSEADIRSTNFYKANLSQTNFSGAIGGIQKHWWLVQQFLALIIAALSSFLSAFSGVLIAVILFYQSNDASVQITFRVAGVVTLLILAVTMLSIARQGFTTKILTGNEKFSLLRTWSNAFGAIGGTSFVGADLTGSNFKQTVLTSTNPEVLNDRNN